MLFRNPISQRDSRPLVYPHQPTGDYHEVDTMQILTTFKFELDDYATDLLFRCINDQRIKYMRLVIRCMTSANYLYEGVYTVQYCTSMVKRLDKLQTAILTEPVCTYSETDLKELEQYHHIPDRRRCGGEYEP